MFGKIYKRALDFVRSKNLATKIIWGIKVHRKLIEPTWDVTSLTLKKAFDTQMKNDCFNFLDMGCGHVALLGQYVKCKYPASKITSVDYYKEFSESAKINVEKNNLEIDVFQSNLFEFINDKFHFISFNPPYKPDENEDIKYRETVYSGDDGMEVTRRFLNDAKPYMESGGKIFLGINCYFVSEKKCLDVIKQAGYCVENIIFRAFNTSRVFIIYPKL